jgi:hypothetical protein
MRLLFLNDFSYKIKEKQISQSTGFSQITENLIKHMTFFFEIGG